MTQSRDVTSEVAAISVSDSPDLAILGFGESHLRNAMADLALFMLAEGMNLVYGGDLREHGFTTCFINSHFAIIGTAAVRENEL